MTGDFASPNTLWWFPLPSVPDTTSYVSVPISFPLPEEGTELREAEFFTQAITDERLQIRGCWPQSPVFLPHHAAIFYFVGMGKGNEGAQGWMKESGTYRIQSVSELCPNCLGVLRSRAGYLFNQEMEHFQQKGNQFSFKKSSRFFPYPSLPDHTPSQPFSRDR